jgi:hypothetical protein
MREVSEKVPHSVEKKCQRTAVAGIGDPDRQPPFSKTGINDTGYNFKRRISALLVVHSHLRCTFSRLNLCAHLLKTGG